MQTLVSDAPPPTQLLEGLNCSCAFSHPTVSHSCLGSNVDPVAMALPVQSFVGAVEDLSSCLATKDTLQGLHMVGSRVSTSSWGLSYTSSPQGCYKWRWRLYLRGLPRAIPVCTRVRRAVLERANVPRCGLHSPPFAHADTLSYFLKCTIYSPVRLCLKQRSRTHSRVG